MPWDGSVAIAMLTVVCLCGEGTQNELALLHGIDPLAN
jgi:hypothetical protein